MIVIDISGSEFQDEAGNKLMVLGCKDAQWFNVVDGEQMFTSEDVEDAKEEARGEGYASGIENAECDCEEVGPVSKLLDAVIEHVGPESVREMTRLDPRAADLLRSVRPDVY